MENYHEGAVECVLVDEGSLHLVRFNPIVYHHDDTKTNVQNVAQSANHAADPLVKVTMISHTHVMSGDEDVGQNNHCLDGNYEFGRIQGHTAEERDKLSFWISL